MKKTELMKVYDDDHTNECNDRRVASTEGAFIKIHPCEVQLGYALCDEEVLTTIPYYETFGLIQSIAKKSSN